ncbi:MAG TPA: serine/threonine-protein kinase, partial [Polyangia bacterium]|nr:serine/threonine-protein kinase [Polyangia bacterium]
RRDLAIKVLLSELGGREEFARRFEREAESASRLDHPNIITVTDFGRTPDGALFLAMEFLAGDSLTVLIKGGPLPRERALAIIRQILRALDHAHGAGVVHRDLKPDNIMLVERDGQRDVVKILDFGIAKVTQPTSGQEALTQAGVIFGTPEYLSPEQALGEAVDARADLYAAGVILYEMLAGRRPFESEDKVKIISMHLSHPPPRLSDANPTIDVPFALEQVVLQALEKHRENRFASATAFLQALEESEAVVEGSEPWELGDTAPHDAQPSAGVVRPRARRRVVAAALAVLAVGGLSAAGMVALRGRALRSKNAAGLSARPTEPAPATPALANELKRVEGFLEEGNTVAARLALDDQLARRPRDARLHYMLGRLAFADNRHAEGLASYREAIVLDDGFRGDPVLLSHVDTALSEPRQAQAALDLIIEKIGPPAADLLEKVANEGGDLARRRRAAAALDEMGKGSRVDRVELLVLELKKAQTCEERKELVEKLRAAGDRRALPALKTLRPHGNGLSRLMSRLGGGAGVACMKKELADAIKELEEKS